MSSPTRLLVLGAVRFMQPVHGYDVRRELVSWRLEEWTSVKPGSIYGALRTLERDGCIAMHARGGEKGRPERTTYVLTGEGEKEFQALLRESFWTVAPPRDPLFPALSLMQAMPRAELIRASVARMHILEAELEGIAFKRAQIRDGADPATGAIPEHVREVMDLAAATRRAELEWTRGFHRRLRAGAYRLIGDDSAI